MQPELEICGKTILLHQVQHDLDILMTLSIFNSFLKYSYVVSEPKKITDQIHATYW